MISYKDRSSSLRKVKTDAVDAYHLCELFYKEELEPYKKRGVQLLNLRNLTRQHENITGVFVQDQLTREGLFNYLNIYYYYKKRSWYDMDAILFAILFTIPGLMVRNIEKRLYTKTKEADSDIIKQYNFFIDSAFIYFLGLILYQILLITPALNGLNEIDINGIFLTGNELKLFIFYFLWSLAICLPYAKTKKFLVQTLFLWLSNNFRRRKSMPIETVFSSIWDEIFENPEMPITSDQIVILEKDGLILTQGYIKRYSPPHLSRREFLLEETSYVKAFLDSDKKCESEDEKLLNVVKMEYYDTQTGITVKFIDTSKLVRYLAQVNSNF